MNGFTVMWPCSETIKVGYSGSFVSDLITAIEIWNNAIGLAGAGPMPTFEHKTSGSVDVPVIIPQGAGSVYCGDFSSNYRTINIYTDQDCDDHDHPGDLVPILIHELAHALGWTAAVHTSGVSGMSDHCVVRLIKNQPMNENICAHEIEGALSAYGLRSELPNDFWSYPFATGSWSLQSSVTVAATSTVQLTPGNWRLEVGGTVAGGYDFASDNTAVATVSNGGLVTGVSVGSTTIRVRATSATNAYPTRKFQEVGETVSVTVTAPPPPPPPPPLVVTHITRSGPDTLPFHYAGDDTLTAHLDSGHSSSGVTYRWSILFSTAPGDSIIPHKSATPPWGGSTYVLTIPGPDPVGSYTIRVIVIPGKIVGTDTLVGSATIRDFTVCPPLVTEYVRFKGTESETPDAVANCAPQ